MNKFLVFILFLSITLSSYSQIKVLSFETDEADLTPRINPKQDRNGNDCAMLRITTKGMDGEQRRKFCFSGEMATWVEFDELLNTCNWEWTTQGGKAGNNITEPNGNSIFIPAAGYMKWTNLLGEGENGCYWKLHTV